MGVAEPTPQDRLRATPLAKMGVADVVFCLLKYINNKINHSQ